MKKSIFALLCLFALPIYSQWVLLQQQAPGSPTTNITFTNLITSTYEDYIFVVDILGSPMTATDIVMQVSNWIMASIGFQAIAADYELSSRRWPATEFGRYFNTEFPSQIFLAGNYFCRANHTE